MRCHRSSKLPQESQEQFFGDFLSRLAFLQAEINNGMKGERIYICHYCRIARQNISNQYSLLFSHYEVIFIIPSSSILSCVFYIKTSFYLCAPEKSTFDITGFQSQPQVCTSILFFCFFSVVSMCYCAEWGRV